MHLIEGTVLVYKVYQKIENYLKVNALSNTYLARELLGFTCMSSLTMNEKFQYHTRPPSAVLKLSSSLLVSLCR